jgi:hypothetical protein
LVRRLLAEVMEMKKDLRKAQGELRQWRQLESTERRVMDEKVLEGSTREEVKDSEMAKTEATRAAMEVAVADLEVIQTMVEEDKEMGVAKEIEGLGSSLVPLV